MSIPCAVRSRSRRNRATLLACGIVSGALVGISLDAGSLMKDQGPFAAILLVIPAYLDMLAAAEVLTRHGHDHGHDHDGGDCKQCEQSVLRLQKVVAAVDATSFLAEWMRADDLAERGLLSPVSPEDDGDDADDDYRTVADVLCSQVETADTLVLTGGGQATMEEQTLITSVLRRLCPSAHLLSLGSSDGAALYDAVSAASSGRAFHVHEAENGAGWLQLLNSEHADSGSGDGEGNDTDAYTWGAVYRRRRPFHPGRRC